MGSPTINHDLGSGNNAAAFAVAAKGGGFENPTGQPLSLRGEGSFTKYYLAITRDQYFAKKEAGFFQVPDNLKALRLQTVAIRPDVQEFLEFINYVGGPWGWPNRIDYQPDQKERLKDSFNRDDAKMWQFQAGGNDLRSGLNVTGFCLVRSINPNAPDKHTEGHKQGGLTKRTIERLFRERFGLPNGGPVLEIDKIGLHDDCTGYGLGPVYIGEIMENLFAQPKKKSAKPCVGVILDTRSTNHAGVLRFYQECGFSLLCSEELPSDLISLPDSSPRPLEKRFSVTIEDVLKRHASELPLPVASAAPTLTQH
jgi:hypothetical protein